MVYRQRSVMAEDSFQLEAGKRDGVLDSDLVDLNDVALADIGRFNNGALGDAVRRILDDTSEQVANFCNSM
jgi:hypothetical protein